MIIRKVNMVNFRGFSKKTIDFQDSPVVLLSAANGVGKTTTIDAIEWCLTGNIGRLKAAFDTRSTNDGDRKMNSPGILKNRNAGKKAKVKVELTLFDGENEHLLCREQTRDELNSDEFTLTLDKSKEEAEKFILDYIGNSFYNLHFCDIQKSFNVQSTKRDKLKDLFVEFIRSYDTERQVAKNLDIFAKDVEHRIEDIKKQKTPIETISFREELLQNAQKRVKQLPYPAVQFYPEEKTVVANLSKEALTAQQQAVKNCGFLVAKEAMEKLAAHETKKNQRSVVREIVSLWETKGESIHRAIAIGFPENSDAITARIQKLTNLKRLTLARDSILQEGAVLMTLGNSDFSQSFFDAVRSEITEKEKAVADLSSEIDLLTKNNRILKLLSSLSSPRNKQLLIDYRDSAVTEHGTVRCPICGSESFANLEADSILKEALEYIQLNDAAVKAKATDQSSLQEQIDGLYQKLILSAKQVVEKERHKLTDEITSLKNLQNEVQPYFDAVGKLLETMQDIRATELTAKRAAQLLTEIEDALLDETQELGTKAKYQQLLTVLDYQFEHETVKTTLAMVNGCITDTHAVSNFTYELLVAKLNSLDSLLANQDYLNQKQELDRIYQRNTELDAQINELQKLKDTATQRAIAIRETVDQLSSDEYEKVGPALGKYYNKLARFNSAEGIRIKLEKDGISLVDNNDKNIVNVLSNGQISVFMLAYFFAGINVRNEHEKMKVYFIDDLTACMDDVNMLAFLDILKYQMSTRETMEQLFFITCDDRISRLLKYKLNGRGVEFCELVEKDFI